MRLKVSQTELLFKRDARFDVTLKIILVFSILDLDLYIFISRLTITLHTSTLNHRSSV